MPESCLLIILGTVFGNILPVRFNVNVLMNHYECHILFMFMHCSAYTWIYKKRHLMFFDDVMKCHPRLCHKNVLQCSIDSHNPFLSPNCHWEVVPENIIRSSYHQNVIEKLCHLNGFQISHKNVIERRLFFIVLMVILIIKVPSCSSSYLAATSAP